MRKNPTRSRTEKRVPGRKKKLNGKREHQSARGNSNNNSSQKRR